MNEKELIPLLALLDTAGVGSIMAKRLIHHCGSAQAVFEASDKALLAIEGLGQKSLSEIRREDPFSRAESEYRLIQEQGLQTLFYKDENYPSYLKECIDGPVLLFGSGDLNFDTQRIISIVGTRNITASGIQFCNELIESLVPYNPIIVSGFAYGVDITAHLAALDNQLSTVGVLAHGMDQIYPKSHQKYVTSILGNGGFLSEYWSGVGPDRKNFVQRNRIVAGMSQATIVIESAEKGGSMITAKMANDYSRDVFAVPGRTTDKYSQGCNILIKTNQAHLLQSVKDLEYILNWDKEEQQPSKKELQIALDPVEQTIYDHLNQKGKSLLDEIAVECDIPTHKLSSVLLTMELKEAIRPLPGKLFEVK